MSEDPELARQQNREEVPRHCLARLSPDHREVLHLVYFHRKWIKEVAQIVGTDETVRARMCDARKRLTELVELCTYISFPDRRS
jgi:RNA polymerase sigma-70 factor, ECF subfamily